MEQRIIKTRLGDISLALENQGEEAPLVFLHGVFLDRSLWKDCARKFPGRKNIYIDMPAHGKSGSTDRSWNLEDCVNMLMEILDELEIPSCYLIGHSWGSMTALRAARKFPERFKALALFNMPHQRTSGWRRVGFYLQKMFLGFPRFYGARAARALYSRDILRKQPELILAMQTRLAARSPRELARVINAVILEPGDATELIRGLQTPALAVYGEEDYVGRPPIIKARRVPGGHITPQESANEAREAIRSVVAMN